MTDTRGLPARVGAAALAVLLAASACTVASDDGTGRNPPVDRSTTTAPGSASSSRADPDADPLPKDVPDATFAGLGDPRIDVQDYAVTLTADPGKPRIEGRVVIELEPVGPLPVDEFTLDLRGPKVTAAEVGGQEAKVTATDAEVTITPTVPLDVGISTRVVVEYAGVPATKPLAAIEADIGWQADDRGGWFTMSEPNGTETWVPVSDHPSDKATWSVTIDTPKGTTGVSNGHLVSKEAVGDRVRWAWRTDEPMATYLVLVAVGRYDLVTRKAGDRHLTFAFPTDLPAAKRAGFDDTVGILDYFSQTFGPLPSDRTDGEDAGAIVVDKELEVALETQTRPLFGTGSVGDGRVGALAHELAHQWFGDAVTLSNWRDLWLNEGFATYGDWLYRDHTGDQPLEDSVQTAMDHSRDDGLTVRDPVGTATFDAIVYERGALTLQALRRTVGDATFFRILRTWVDRNAGRSASSDEFVALASNLADRDLAPLFHDWLDEIPLPDLPS